MISINTHTKKRGFTSSLNLNIIKAYDLVISINDFSKSIIHLSIHYSYLSRHIFGSIQNFFYSPY